jgi:dynein heavy chain, axonemal
VASPALQLNHWELIFQALNHPMPEGGPAGFTFRDLLLWGLEDHAEEVEGISAMAQREYSMLRALDAMRVEMDKMAFNVIAYKDSHSMWVISHVDELQQLLDDQALRIQAMTASPFIQAIKEEVRAWDTTLAQLQELIDEWTKCQSHWMYLEPIFSSEDIQKAMPDEAEKFIRVDQSLREVMAQVVENPHALTLSKNQVLLELLVGNNGLLDSCMKGLTAYLERKRLAFPRFFFLSNEEILEILSETREPERVQPHLNKCFEGIDRLGFVTHDKDQIVVEMLSADRERIPFVTKVNTRAARGAVEKWLLQVESSMFEAVHHVTSQAIEDYPRRARVEWCLAWPGMAALSVSSLFWTVSVERAIREASLSDMYAQCDRDLMDIVAKVRGELTPLERVTLGTLVVQDVHARDVVAFLRDQHVTDPNDFNWKSQLRCYWEDREVPDGTRRRRMSLALRMMMAEVEYGYEYLGNSTRLVITPLTDRCYRTLMMAYHLTLGGSPEGPAGTGKTETTKDLAKAVAKQCLVFNCSDSLDYIAMGKFFKGLAASGAWACLDEFNRIGLEVLSVAAQQIMSIQLAIQQRVLTFTFEGSELQLVWSCWIGITMNVSIIEYILL